MSFKILAVITLLFSNSAKADLDPISGARVSVAATQNILATSPLPSLDKDRSKTTIQASYMSIDMEGQDEDTMTTYEGDFSGGAIAIGYSTAIRGRISYYGSFIANSISGDAVPNDTPTATHKFSTTGMALTGGIALRLIGTDNSLLTLGVFGGPAVMRFTSELKIEGIAYNSSPLIYGPLAGIQLRIQFPSFMVSPYAIYMKELSEECKKVTSVVGTIGNAPACPTGSSGSPIDASFAAYGIVLGYGALQLNVYSKLVNDDTMDDLEIFNFALGYSF